MVKRVAPSAGPEGALDPMVEGLRARGLKLTPQRLAIIRELAGDPTHPTAMELFERLRPALPTMSFATVYNTLAALTEQGLCEARALEPGPIRFDPNVAPHDHAVCDGCGLVIDVALGHEGPVTKAGRAAPPEGFAIRSVERIYRGLCADCSAHRGRARGVEQGTGD